ncbi:hypothetical protein DY000_02049021 [Brassica cretica]|uniref:Uncharacterized protein n=1 Tax=Brassica cretica TaxID=69181 RepID=A0ABQ7EWV7_BRACR|nr:hypothetical protein DY000_02049021 [Brassica cretica]
MSPFSSDELYSQINLFVTVHVFSQPNEAPKDDGEEDSSADKVQPANHRRIEVILSQQTLSSDDENDDAPIPGDLRDVLKRKLESKDDNSS